MSNHNVYVCDYCEITKDSTCLPVGWESLHLTLKTMGVDDNSPEVEVVTFDFCPDCAPKLPPYGSLHSLFLKGCATGSDLESLAALSQKRLEKLNKIASMVDLDCSIGCCSHQLDSDCITYLTSLLKKIRKIADV